MKKIFLLLTVSLTLVACESTSDSVTTSQCTDAKVPPGDTSVKYKVDEDGDFSVTMKLKHNVHSDSAFKIKLIPQGNESKDVVITTKGVSGTKPDGTSTAFGWLDGSGSFNSTDSDHNHIILCVPDDAQPGSWYKYDIYIGDTGSIDPRVDVM